MKKRARTAWDGGQPPTLEPLGEALVKHVGTCAHCKEHTLVNPCAEGRRLYAAFTASFHPPAETKHRMASRAQILTHAAALLEREADSIRRAHTVDDWRWWHIAEQADVIALREHDDMIETAHRLRALAGEGR